MFEVRVYGAMVTFIGNPRRFQMRAKRYFETEGEGVCIKCILAVDAVPENSNRVISLGDKIFTKWLHCLTYRDVDDVVDSLDSLVFKMEALGRDHRCRVSIAFAASIEMEKELVFFLGKSGSGKYAAWFSAGDSLRELVQSVDVASNTRLESSFIQLEAFHLDDTAGTLYMRIFAGDEGDSPLLQSLIEITAATMPDFFGPNPAKDLDAVLAGFTVVIIKDPPSP